MLTRWDPFREMMAIRNTMDRMFDSALTGTSTNWQPATWDLALDVSENQDEFIVKASLPGIDPEDLEITFNNNNLTIKGETGEDKEEEGERYHLRERRFGAFSRSITLPAGIEGDRIEARYDGGVLKLRLPKAEEVKPKKISIQSGEPRRVIEAKASEPSKN
jgi:HSP20 family protein